MQQQRLSLPPSWSSSDRLIARRIAQPLQQFLNTEASGGIVLAIAALVALLWANSPWADSYEQLWQTKVTLSVGSFTLDHDLKHWVNDLAMALFFFVAGLEIKRELVHGDLASPRAAALPIACAIGGMVVPALLYTALNAGDDATSRGWGVPMATDIAFTIGVLTLLGRRVPASLKGFLLTLAIVDDIGAIVVIAVFYSKGLSLGWLGAAIAALAVVLMLQRSGVRWLAPYVGLAGILWLAVLESGVHATIAGVVLGLVTPARPFHHPIDVQREIKASLAGEHLTDEVSEEVDTTSFLQIAATATEGVSPLARLEHRLHPWASFAVLPVFALANAGVPLSGGIDFSSGLTLGILLGLVVGKPLGIVLAAVVARRFLGASLPRHAGWAELLGAGMLAGIGFTVSLFVAGLAFDASLTAQASLAVLLASVVAGAAGAALLLARPSVDPLVPGAAPKSNGESSD